MPVEDIETTFMGVERTADFQEVTVQITARYRCDRPVEAAAPPTARSKTER